MFHRQFILSTLVSLVLITSFSYAQNLWEENGVALRQGDYLHWEGSCAYDADGYIYIPKSECIDAMRSVVLQKYSPDGEPIWEGDGVRLSTSFVSWNWCPIITPMEDDGLIVSWEEYDYEVEQYFLKAQKVSSNGEIQWPAGGVIGCTNDNDRNYHEIISDGTGGAYLVWHDEYSYNDWDVAVQRIDADGNIPAGWIPEGNPVDLEEGDRDIDGVDDICLIDGECLMVCWQEYISGVQYLYGQKFSPGGEWLWPDTGLVLCDAEGSKYGISVASDNTGGSYIVWSGDDGASYNVYANHILHDGTLVCDLEGFPVAEDEHESDGIQDVLTDGSGGLYVVFSKNTGWIADYDFYIQKIDSTCHAQWNLEGMPVCLANRNQTDIRIIQNSLGCIDAVWRDTRDSGGTLYWSDLYAQRLDGNGNYLWQEDGIPIAAADETQQDAAIIPQPDGGVSYLWLDYRNSVDIYTQRVDSEGHIQLAEDGVSVCYSILGGIDFPKFTELADDLYLCVWEDEVAPTNKLYYQIFDTEGNILLEENGLKADTSSAFLYYGFDICRTLEGEGVMVWSSLVDNQHWIKAQKVNGDGDRLWSESGILVHQLYDNTQTSPKLCPDNEGGVYVAWNQAVDPHTGGIRNVYVQRMDAAGSPVWGGEPLLVSSASDNQYFRDVCQDIDGQAYVTWIEDHGICDYELFASMISEDGAIPWTINLGSISSGSGDVNAVPSRDSGLIIAWSKQNAVNKKCIWAQKLTAGGEFLWGDSCVVASQSSFHNERPVIIENDDGTVFIVYLQDGNSTEDNIRVQKLSAAGEVLFQPVSKPVIYASDNQSDHAAVSDGNGGFYAGWLDDRDESRDIYALHLDSEAEIIGPVWNYYGNPVRTYYDTDANYLTVVEDGAGGVIFGWEDRRASAPPGWGWGSDIYIQRVNDFYTGIGDPPVSGLMPETTELLPAYPNPFNAATTLSFKLQAAGEVSLKVFDVTGREAASLVTGHWSLGYHEVVWDAEGSASGIYFVRLQAEGGVKSQKLLLLK